MTAWMQNNTCTFSFFLRFCLFYIKATKYIWGVALWKSTHTHTRSSIPVQSSQRAKEMQNVKVIFSVQWKIMILKDDYQMSLSCKMSLFIYKNWRNKRQDSVFTSFFYFIFLICIYTHIVKQITKHIQIPYAICMNYKLYLALVFK